MTLSEYSIVFMPPQVTSLGGQSGRDYETLWNPVHWKTDSNVWTSQDELFGEFVTQSGTDVFTVSARGNSPSVLARALGMYLVGHMPEEGLMETVTALNDFFEFYAVETSRYLQHPRVESLHATVTKETPNRE